MSEQVIAYKCRRPRGRLGRVRMVPQGSKQEPSNGRDLRRGGPCTPESGLQTLDELLDEVPGSRRLESFALYRDDRSVLRQPEDADIR